MINLIKEKLLPSLQHSNSLADFNQLDHTDTIDAIRPLVEATMAQKAVHNVDSTVYTKFLIKSLAEDYFTEKFKSS